MKTPKLIIFDVNETLLDMAPLKLAINKQLEHPYAFDTWFSLLLQYAWVESLSGHYRPFGEIGLATLKMAADKLQRNISEVEAKTLLVGIRQLSPHTDVIPGMEQLAAMGIPMVALTNGSPDAAKEQLAYSKIDRYLNRAFSVEAVGQYKPHPAAYEYVLKEMNMSAAEAVMVACHPWDLLGAKRAGLKTCYVHRPGMPLYPLGEPFDLEIKGIEELAEGLKR